jgi:hypothetical protein
MILTVGETEYRDKNVCQCHFAERKITQTGTDFSETVTFTERFSLFLCYTWHSG